MAPPISGSSPTEPQLLSTMNPPLHQSAFRPVIRGPPIGEQALGTLQDTSQDGNNSNGKEENSDDEVDIETTEDDPATPLNATLHNLHSATNSGIAGGHSTGRNVSPQCWSPPRETVSLDIYRYIFRLLLSRPIIK